MRPALACTQDLIGTTVPSAKVVALYEDIATGVKAEQMTDFLFDNLGATYTRDTALWNVALIEIRSLSALVAAEAAEADIAIISLHDGNGLSLSLRMWINQWLTKRKGTHSAAIVLFENPGPATEFAQRHLRNAALRAGVDFFTQIGKTTEQEIHASGLLLAV